MSSINSLLECLQESKSTVLVTGYKVLNESNIPDIQDTKGWWNETDPKIAASLNTMDLFYDKFREFYSMRIEDLKSKSHNNIHSTFAKWQKNGTISSIVTQCVDDYHEDAGCSIVYHINGRLNNIICKACNQVHNTEDFINNNKCNKCNSDLRPDIVLYGDPYREYEWFRTLNEIKYADTVILVGTNLLGDKVKAISNAKLIVIDDIMDDNIIADLMIKGNINDIVKAIDNLI